MPKQEMNEFVLDSSAVLAYLHKETGWQIVEQILQTADCLISTVNYSEIISKLVEKGLPIDAICNALDALNLKLIDFDNILSMSAGLLIVRTKPAGLSLGDRACLALAKHHNIPVLTADKAWKKIDIGVSIKTLC